MTQGSEALESSRDVLSEGDLSGFITDPASPNYVQNLHPSSEGGLPPQTSDGPPLGGALGEVAPHAQPLTISDNTARDSQVKRKSALRKGGGGKKAEAEDGQQGKHQLQGGLGTGGLEVEAKEERRQEARRGEAAGKKEGEDAKED